MKYVICLGSLVSLLAFSGCVIDRDHDRGRYGPEYHHEYHHDEGIVLPAPPPPPGLDFDHHRD